MNPPSPPGEVLTLHIESLAQGGDGVARHEGQVVFVAGALPGETVTGRVTRRQRNFLRASLIEITAASPSRRALDCAHETASGCGGCGFRQVADEASLALKAGAAWQALQRISRRPWPQPRVHPSPLEHSRSRVRFHGSEGRIGLHARGSHAVVPVPGCLAATPEISAAATALEDAWRHARRAPPRLLIEAAGDDLFLTLAGAPLHILEDRAQDALDLGLFAGVRLDADRGPRWLGTEWISSSFQLEESGPASRPDTLWRRPGAFSQANRIANDQLREILFEALTPAPLGRLLDLYAGSGNFSLPLAHLADGVIAVEHAPDSLDGLRRSIERAHPESPFRQVRALEHDLRDALPAEIQGESFDAVLLDPPRTGAKNLMPTLRELAPPRLLYVSCAPACLARDVASLGEAYEIEDLHAVDMFPRTPHLELVAVLRRTTD